MSQKGGFEMETMPLNTSWSTVHFKRRYGRAQHGISEGENYYTIWLEIEGRIEKPPLFYNNKNGHGSYGVAELWLRIQIHKYFFGGLECVGHSFAYIAHL
jgi:hypothetical protein